MNIISKFKEIYSYKEMLRTFVMADLRTRYRGSVLGFLWNFLNPLFMLIIYSLVFRIIARIDMENYTIFLFIGLIHWNFFQNSVLNSSDIVINNSNLVKKIYFPKEILPLSLVISNSVNYFFNLIILFIAMIITGVNFSYSILFLPVVFAIQFILNVGLSLIISGLNVYYRDIKHILAVIFMGWFYFTPILYTEELIPQEYKVFFNINPMKDIIVFYQEILYYGEIPNLESLLIYFVISIIILSISLKVFNKLSIKFAEEL